MSREERIRQLIHLSKDLAIDDIDHILRLARKLYPFLSHKTLLEHSQTALHWIKDDQRIKLRLQRFRVQNKEVN
jgi:hypothetical protein